MDVHAIQEPLKAGYRSDPQSGRITLTARGGRVGEPIGWGDLDLRGTLGVDREAPVGFTDIRLSFAIDAPGASAEDLEGLRRRTERYCVVQQTLVHPPAISTSWSDAPTGPR